MKKSLKNCLVFLSSFILVTMIANRTQPVKAVTYDQFNCADNQYSLDVLSQNPTTKAADYKLVKCYASFNEANAAMKAQAASNPNLVVRSKSFGAPLKVMSQATGYAIATKGVTVYIYRNPNLTTSTSDWSTYVVKGTKMYYYDSMINSNGKLVHHVSISGYNGYISSDYSDLIPMEYIVKDIPFILRNDSTTKSYAKTNTNHYEVRSSGKGYNELYFYYQSIDSIYGYFIGPFAKTPSWLPVGYYYSRDGITFYTDPYYKNVVNNGAKFYNYYQYLPMRSKSNLTGQQLDNYLAALGKTSSVYYGKSQTFVDGQNKYGMNALLVYSMAGIESAYGTSYIARNKYNLFGWNAYDSDTTQASYYKRVEDSILQHMSINLFGYMNVLDWRFTGPSLGNKGHGFNTKYASDPNWGLSIAAVAYQTDKYNGFQDLNYYKLGVLSDKSNINVRNKPSLTGSIVYYSTLGGDKALINQSVAVTNQTNGFYETISWYPIVNGKVLTSHNGGAYSMNLNANAGYIDSRLVSIVSDAPYRPQQPTTPTPTTPTTPTGPTQLYEVTANVGLKVRSSKVIDPSTQIGYLDYKAQVQGVMDGEWLKITYNNQPAYVYAQYVKLVQPTTPTAPTTTAISVDELIKQVGSVVNTNVVTNVNINTTVDSIVSKIKAKDANAVVTITNASGSAKTGQVLTGDKITIKSGTTSKTWLFAIKGDVNGDGEIDSFDALDVLLQINGHKQLSKFAEVAAELTQDTTIDVFDVRQILLHINGHIDLRK